VIGPETPLSAMGAAWPSPPSRSRGRRCPI